MKVDRGGDQESGEGITRQRLAWQTKLTLGHKTSQTGPL